jgi:hypothetical protein
VVEVEVVWVGGAGQQKSGSVFFLFYFVLHVTDNRAFISPSCLVVNPIISTASPAPASHQGQKQRFGQDVLAVNCCHNVLFPYDSSRRL